MKKELENKELAVISQEETAMVNLEDSFFNEEFDTNIASQASSELLVIDKLLSLKKEQNVSNATYWAPYDNSGLTDAISIKTFLADCDNDFAVAQKANDERKMLKAFTESSKYRRIAIYLGMAVIDAMYDGKTAKVKHAFFTDKFTGATFKMAHTEVLSKLSATTTTANGEVFKNFVKGQLLCLEYKGKITKTKTYHSFEITQVSFS